MYLHLLTKLKLQILKVDILINFLVRENIRINHYQ